MPNQPGPYPESVIDAQAQGSTGPAGPGESRTPASQPVFNRLFTSPFRPEAEPLSLKDALTDLYEAARGILQRELTKQSNGDDNGHDDGQPMLSQLEDEEIEDFLARILDLSRVQLENQYERWRQVQRAGDEHSKKHERGGSDGELSTTGSPAPKKQKASGTAAGADAGTSGPDNTMNDFGANDGPSNPMMEELYISESEDNADAVPGPGPGPGLGLDLEATPLQPPTWENLPDNMKLIVVKELTAWMSYGEAARVLGLTKDQDRAFRALYNEELMKQKLFDATMKAQVDVQTRNRDLQRHVPAPLSTLRGPAGPTNSLDVLPVVALRGPSVPQPPQLLTDVVTVEQLRLGEAFLVSAGITRDWVDLGHWTGHSGSGRFTIELGHHELCAFGRLHQEPPAVPPRPPVAAAVPGPAAQSRGGEANVSNRTARPGKQLLPKVPTSAQLEQQNAQAGPSEPAPVRHRRGRSWVDATAQDEIQLVAGPGPTTGLAAPTAPTNRARDKGKGKAVITAEPSPSASCIVVDSSGPSRFPGRHTDLPKE